MMTYNKSSAIRLQHQYCEGHQLPCFAPPTGICFACGLNIYEPITRKDGDTTNITGIGIGTAATSLITGCPHCNRSYCD